MLAMEDLMINSVALLQIHLSLYLGLHLPWRFDQTWRQREREIRNPSNACTLARKSRKGRTSHCSYQAKVSINPKEGIKATGSSSTHLQLASQKGALFFLQISGPAGGSNSPLIC
jgi:hypothetical protein